MQLTYRLLSEDLIETHGHFPAEHVSDHGSVGLLCDRIGEATGFDPPLVRRTIDDFVTAGYLEVTRAGDDVDWRWTQNRRVGA
jgi:hypothetical protein